MDRNHKIDPAYLERRRRRNLKRAAYRLVVCVSLLVGTAPAAGQSSTAASTPGYTANPSETLQRANSATVQIRVYGSKGTQSGSGVIVTFDGYIVTAAHVVDGFSRIRVIVDDGGVHDAQLTDIDRPNDMAMLKINPSAPLKSAVLASHRAAKPGDNVVLIGNPLGMGQSVREGTLGTMQLASHSGKWTALQKISANVQPGHSGGGAFDKETGELLGIVLAKSNVAKSTGYMLPIQRVVAFIERKTPLVQLTDSQEVYDRLGIRFRAVRLLKSRFQFGLLVTNVRASSPADQAGWEVGDVLVGLDEYQMVNADAILFVLREKAAGEGTLAFQVERGDDMSKGFVELNGKPEQAIQQVASKPRVQQAFALSAH